MADNQRAQQGEGSGGELDRLLRQLEMSKDEFERLPRPMQAKILAEILAARAQRAAAGEQAEAARAQRDTALEGLVTESGRQRAADAQRAAYERQEETFAHARELDDERLALDKERLRTQFGLSEESIEALREQAESQTDAARRQGEAADAQREAAEQAHEADLERRNYYRWLRDKSDVERQPRGGSGSAPREREPAREAPTRSRDEERADASPGGSVGGEEKKEESKPSIAAAATQAAITGDPMGLVNAALQRAQLVQHVNDNGRQLTGGPIPPASYDGTEGETAKIWPFTVAAGFALFCLAQVLRGGFA